MIRRRPAIVILLAAVLGCAHSNASAPDPELASARHQAIEGYIPELLDCWFEVMGEYRGPAGSLLFSIDIRKNGKIDWVDIEDDDLGVPQLVTCTVRRIKKWRLPAGKRQTITFGVEFVTP
jgi:hypothetical protein